MNKATYQSQSSSNFNGNFFLNIIYLRSKDELDINSNQDTKKITKMKLLNS